MSAWIKTGRDNFNCQSDIAIRFDNSAENFWNFKEGLVVDAVDLEPVSVREFPANREISSNRPAWCDFES
jgi:hypothetical protein